MLPAKQCGAMDRVGRQVPGSPGSNSLNLRAPAVKWDHNSYSVWGSVRAPTQFGDPVLKLYDLMDWRSSSSGVRFQSFPNPTCTHLSSHASLLGAPLQPGWAPPYVHVFSAPLIPALIPACWLWTSADHRNKFSPYTCGLSTQSQNICNFTSSTLWATWRSVTLEDMPSSLHR